MRSTPQVAVAIANTGTYQFIATGATEREAVDAVLAAWREHAERHYLDDTYLDRDDINVMTGPVGQAFRDYKPFPQPLETMPPVPTGAGLCARCGHWEAKPNKHPRCPSCGRPWDTVVGEGSVQQ